MAAATSAPVERPMLLTQLPSSRNTVWSAIAAQQLGVPATAIEGAVAARSISSRKDERVAAEKVYGKLAGLAGKALDMADLEKALLAGKIVGLGVLGFGQMLVIAGAGLAAAAATGALDVTGDVVSAAALAVAWFVLG